MSVIKIICLFIVVIMFSIDTKAQSRTSTVKTEFSNLKIHLKMNDKTFNEFRHNLAVFNDSIIRIMNQQGISMEERKSKVGAIQSSRNEYLQKTLSSEQYSTFVDFEKNIQRSSVQRKRLEGKKL